MATLTETIRFTRVRPLREIAGEIIRRWESPAVTAVVPLYGMVDRHIMTRADERIVGEFLTAADGWSGPHATRIKSELRRQLFAL